MVTNAMGDSYRLTQQLMPIEYTYLACGYDRYLPTNDTTDSDTSASALKNKTRFRHCCGSDDVFQNGQRDLALSLRKI